MTLLSTGVKQSTRVGILTRKMLDSIAQEHLVFSTFTDKGHAQDYLIQQATTDPIAFKANTDPDTLYYHEAIAASDADNFTDAIIKDVDAHCERNHLKLGFRSKVPTKHNIPDSV